MFREGKETNTMDHPSFRRVHCINEQQQFFLLKHVYNSTYMYLEF